MTDTPDALVKLVEPLLRYHETGGHEGNGSDEQLAKIRAALATLPAAAPADVLEGLLLSAYRTGYRDGVEDHDAVLDVELLLREQAPEGFVQWRAEHQSELARLSAPQPPATAPADVVGDTIWARDLDGTGSMHVCAPNDPGAVAYSRAAPAEQGGDVVGDHATPEDWPLDMEISTGNGEAPKDAGDNEALVVWLQAMAAPYIGGPNDAVARKFDEAATALAARNEELERLRAGLVMAVAEMSRAQGRLEIIAGCNEDRRLAAALGGTCDFARRALLAPATGEAGK